MTAALPTAPVAEAADSFRRLALRTVRHFRAQAEDWYDECRALADWEDQNLVDHPSADRLAEHARWLDELERVGHWLASATQCADFPDRGTSELVDMTLRDLADCRAMWHGRNLDRQQRADILKTCFNES